MKKYIVGSLFFAIFVSIYFIEFHESSAAGFNRPTLQPGSKVGLQRPIYDTDKSGWLTRVTTRTIKDASGTTSATDQTVTYEPKPTIHKTALVVLSAELTHISLDGLDPVHMSVLATKFYDMAQAMWDEGESRDLIPSP